MANTKVYGEQIVDGSITAAKLADGTIVAAELANNAVETAAINADAVTGAKIADDAIDSEHYVDGSIDTAHIANDQVTQAKIADDAVGADQLAASAVVTASIVDDNVTTAKIADGNISTALLADNAVTSAKLANNIDIAGTFDVTGATTLDSTLSVAGNVSIGVTPKTWHADWEVLQIGERASFYSQASTTTGIGENVYYDSGWKAIATAAGSLYQQDSGNHHFYTMASVSADATSSPSEKFTILNNGNVGIGTTSPAHPLQVGGTTRGTASIVGVDGSSPYLKLDHTPTSSGRAYSIYSGGLAAGNFDIYDNTASAGRLSIDSSGNVGIGTASPDKKLEVAGTDVVAKFTGTDANPPQIEFEDSTGVQATIGLNTGHDFIIDTAGENVYLGANASSLGTGTFTVLSTGNVGIGTVSPTNTLDLGAATSGRALTFAKYSNLFSEYSNASFWLASNFYGNAGASGYKAGATGNFGAAGIRVHGTGGGSNSGIIQFYTDTNTSKTADDAFTPTERMRISSTGDVGINVTAPVHRLEVKATKANYASSVLNVDTGSGPTNYGMHVNLINDPNDGTRYLWNGQSGNSTKAQIMSNGSYQSATNSYGSTSDEKLKENIKDASNKLDEVLQLKVRNFNYKADSDKQKLIGMIAQEVETVFPALVFESEDTETVNGEIKSLGTKTKSLKYSVFVPILIKAIQEQQEQIEAQATSINELKTRIEALES